MHAVIRTGGKQYRVQEGETLRVEKIDADVGTNLQFVQVLALGEGESLAVGTPYVEGAKVSAEITGQGRGKKIRVFKYKKRKGYRRTQGHRQAFTEVRITGVSAA